MSATAPVLFLIFNRPDTTAQVFEQIKKAKPKQLFVAADGPRKHKVGEQELCAAARQIVIDGVDWDCEVKMLFRDANLGCGKAVSESITWFFSLVEEGIILEDDCLPVQSFFQFCSELLGKFRNDERVMSVSGTNFLGHWDKNKQSYFFGHGGIWGWATWKRAWNLYDFFMRDWNLPAVKKLVRQGLQTIEWYDFYSEMFDSVYNNKLDTWDAQWLYTVLINDGVIINPSVNLIRNIGFGINATHTHDSNDLVQNLKSYEMGFPLRHPKGVFVDVKYLKAFQRVFFGKNTSIRLVIKRIIVRYKYKLSLYLKK